MAEIKIETPRISNPEAVIRRLTSINKLHPLDEIRFNAAVKQIREDKVLAKEAVRNASRRRSVW